MRPKKYEAEVEARKCEVEAEAKKNYVRPRPKHMRPRPQCLMNHATLILSYCISYIIKPTSVRHNEHSKTFQLVILWQLLNWFIN